jgi:hypothetical protein
MTESKLTNRLEEAFVRCPPLGLGLNDSVWLRW